MSRRPGPTRRMLIEVSPRLRPSSRPAAVGQSSPSMWSEARPVRNSTKIVMSPAGISPLNPIVLSSETPVTPPPAWAARARGSPRAPAVAVAAPWRRAATSASPRANVRRSAGAAPWPVLRNRFASEGTRRPRRSRRAGHFDDSRKSSASRPRSACLGGGGATRSLTQRFLRPVLTTTVPFLHFFAAGLAASADAGARAGVAAIVATNSAASRVPFMASASLHRPMGDVQEIWCAQRCGTQPQAALGAPRSDRFSIPGCLTSACYCSPSG